MSNEIKVMATYLFPNKMVATLDHNNNQIPELQGVYSQKLEDEIKKHSDSNTVWNGFE